METEARIKVRDVEKLKNELIKLGASFGEPKTQEDRYFYTKEQLSKEVQGPGSFTLRTRKSDKCFLTYKAFTGQIGSWDEHEVLINDAEIMNNILRKAGLVQICHVIKTRTKGKLNEFELCFDDVKNLGIYLEIALEGEEQKSAREKIISFLNKLGYEEKDIEHRGYPEIILAGKLKFGGMR